MAPAELAVVIPTRDRCARLSATLAALAQDPQAERLEVFVVDDGSRDGTARMLETRTFGALALSHTSIAGAGPAVARNLGVARTRAPRILLLGDDTRPAPGALAAHVAAPAEEGLQGHIDWDPDWPITPVMRFLAPAGPQFWFAGLADGDAIPYTGLLGSNLSAPRAWLVAEPFDEGFAVPGFEDTELGWRWQRRGWRTRYGRQALCWHCHPYESLTPFLARQRRAGAAARHAIRRHPRLLPRTVLLPALVGLAFTLRLATRALRGRSRPEDRWDLASRWAFLRGFLVGARPRAGELQGSAALW
jgi:glycosyltransferase involved in cell wall biosynthesis